MKLNRFLWLPLVITALYGLYSCATQSSVDKKIEAEVKSEPAVKTSEVAAKTAEEIINDSDLKPEQRTKLLALNAKTSTQMQAFRAEDNKLKMVLVKTLLDNDSNDKEINKVRDKIVNLEKKKMKSMLDSLSEAKNILGKDASRRAAVMRTFILENTPDRTID